MASVTLEDGVVDYPISEGMDLKGVWNYQPNANGPVISAKQNALSIQRGQVNADNQVTGLSINHPLQAQGGTIISFEIKFNALQPVTEVKLEMAFGLLLRYDPAINQFQYCWWDSNGFHVISASSIVVGSGISYRVVLCISTKSVSIFENGDMSGVWNTSVPATFQPTFDWQILAGQSQLDATLSEILVVPSFFAARVNTPWDIAFSNTNCSLPYVWQSDNTLSGSITIDNSPDGYMRISTDNVTIANSVVNTRMTPMASNQGILMYRLRVNAAKGGETKITIFGGLILRITNNGQQLEWDTWLWWNNGGFRKQGNSSIIVGGANWTVVTLIYSERSISLLEDGNLMFTYLPPIPPALEASFSVQHLDVNTAVSVDLSHLRCLPVVKSTETLVRDLQPDVLTYYPLKSDLSEAIIGGKPLDLSPVNGFRPVFSKGKFGHALNLTTSNGAVEFPSFPYGRCFPSYTLSLWVSIDQYPSGQGKAGIVGPLSLRSDGKLEFTFLYFSPESYGPTNTVFTSSKVLPISQWLSIVITYAYEESRFAIFVNGNLDSVQYTTSNASSQYAILPMLGFVGMTSDSTAPGSLLKGQVGDIIFFKQHLHDMSVQAIIGTIDLPSSKAQPGPRAVRVVFVPLLIPAAFILLYSIVSTATLATYANQTLANPQPTLEEVVSRIIRFVGDPASGDIRVSRLQIGIDDNYIIVLDIGGEGPLVPDAAGGFKTGFQNAINVNDKDISTNPPIGPIPNLVMVKDWATNPSYPFADNFADKMTMVGCPLTPKNVTEFARVIKPRGTIDLWIRNDQHLAAVKLASSVNGAVFFPTKDEDEFKDNGIRWFRKRSIVANKPSI